MSFHAKDGLMFERLEDGSVKVYVEVAAGESPPGKGPKGVLQSQPVFVLEPGTWASAVLSMTAFRERAGDWRVFMRHHMGEKDMLVGQRGGD